jgi:hypothetical protein
MSKASMDWSERQEYYDLIEEEIRFSPKKGQKWILTFQERHSIAHDILFHVYSEQSEYKLLVYEIVDVMELEVKTRLHKLGDTLSGNLRILMSTLKADLPAAMEEDLEEEKKETSPSQFKLSFFKRDKLQNYEWGLPKGEFKRIKPVLKLIWAVDEWWEGSKVMGWSEKEARERKPLGEQSKEKPAAPRDGGKGRMDPFGTIWKGGG